MNRRKSIPVLVFLASALLPGCGASHDPWEDAKPGQKKILAVTPALYCITKNVAGDHVAVACLLSDRGPHDYEPVPNDAARARKADLFLANGLDLDDFVAKIALASGNKKLEIWKIGDELLGRKYHKYLRHTHEHEEGEDHAGHVHGDHDPHVWLAPELAGLLSDLVAAKLSKLDPAHKGDYTENQKKFKAEMDALMAEGKAAFAGKKNKKIVSNHDSMGYFADAFGIDVVDTIQIKPGLEMEPGRLQKLVKKCKEHNVRVLCIEPQFPRASAELLQSELKTKGVTVAIVEFDPLETVAAGETLDAGFYTRRMRKNIQTLAEALE